MKRTLRKISTIIVLATLLFGMIAVIKPEKAMAGSIYITSGYVDIWQGDGATVYLIGDNVAGTCSAWSENGGIASASISTGWVENGSAAIGIYGVSEGYTTVYVSYSVADFENEDNLYSGTFAIGVNVSGWSGGGGDYGEEETEDTRSSDTSLADVRIDGYGLKKSEAVEDAWELEVPNSVTSINLVASANDGNASVSGTGPQNLEIGENYLYITVTAENETTKDYLIYVLRKGGYSALKDLDKAIKETIDGRLNIRLEDGEILDSNSINKIRESGLNTLVYKYDVSMDKINVVAMCTQTENGPVWYELSKDGKTFITEGLQIRNDDMEKGTEETTEKTTEEKILTNTENTTSQTSPVLFVIIAVLGLTVVVLIIMLMRKRRYKTFEEKR